MAVTTAAREGVRKRAVATGKTPTTAGINATVAKNRAAVVVAPPVAAVAQAPAQVPARIARPDYEPAPSGPRPNANAIANANPNARFKREVNPAATAWLKGRRTAMKTALETYTTANPAPTGVPEERGRGRGRGRGRRTRAKK